MTDTVAVVVIKKTFSEIVLNDLTPEQYFAYLVWAIVGLTLSLLWEVIGGWRNIQATNGFSPKYYWNQNHLRILFSFLVINVAIVFYNQLFSLPITSPISTFVALMIGWSHDKAVEALNKLRKSHRK